MPRTRRRAPQVRPTGWLLALVLLSGVGVVPVVVASPAAAHDVLVSSTPAAGAGVPAAPDAVRLTFSEPVLGVGAAVRVTGPAGQVQVGRPQVHGALVSQALRPGAPAGRYVVRWQVASNDGHPVSGRLTYTVRASQPSVSPGVTEPSTPTAAVSSSPSPAVESVATTSDPGTSRAGLVVTLLVLLGALGALGASLARRRRR